MTTLTVNAQTLSTQTAAWLRSDKRTNASQRTYLGMSSIGDCELKLYQQMTDPQPGGDSLAWYHWMGYTVEASVIALLSQAGVPLLTHSDQLPIVADFDARYRGHIDHLLEGNILLEIKTVHWKKLERIVQRGTPEEAHFDQVQAYMAHGGFPKAVIVYVCRDVPYYVFKNSTPEPETFPGFHFFNVEPDTYRQAHLDQKGKRVLAAVDGETTRPECTCGWCE